MEIANDMLNISTIFNLLDYSTDEIFILDRNEEIIYVNKKCEVHYGLKQEDMLGVNNYELVEKGYWDPSIVPLVFERKSPVTIKQQTYLGKDLLTRAIPVLNNNDIDYIFISSTEINSIKNTFISQRKSKNENINTYEEQHLNTVTNNYQMKELYHFCEKVAPTNSTVLIQGESGTGKGVLAKYIHQTSNRKNKKFITINCAALPTELIESELFGYEKGSFTGAINSGKEGLFKIAHNGTIFLDEISEIDISVQAKLLQVIQDKTFRPVGSNQTEQVDVRIIAATNQNLKKLVKEKKFREDLYYRLSVIELNLPTLRERAEDIVPLIYLFLNKFNKKYGTDKVISEQSIQYLKNYSWPGNIRQLENVIERLTIMSDEIIDMTHLPHAIVKEVGKSNHLKTDQGLDFAIDNLTSIIVRESFRIHKSTRKVAQDLNISQSRASRLIRKYCPR